MYFRDYYPQDEAIPRLYRLRDGEIVYKSDLYTDREKKTSAAYNEFRRANNTQNGLFVALEGLDACATVLSFGDPPQRDGWGDDQVRAIKRLSLPSLPARARHERARQRDGGWYEEKE